MNQRAAAFSEQSRKDEIVIAHVPAQEIQESSQATGPRSSDPAVRSMATLVAHLMHMQTTGQQQVAGIRAAVNVLIETIAQTEAEVAKQELHIQRMVEDHTTELSFLMRANASLNEKKAYLEGLKFSLLKITE